MRAIKKIAILLLALLALFLSGCSVDPAFELAHYDMIQCNGVNYSRLEPFGEAQPPNQVSGEIQVFLVGYNGKVNSKRPYIATTYADDPDQIFLFFDGIDWVKEGYYEEWTVPHTP